MRVSRGELLVGLVFVILAWSFLLPTVHSIQVEHTLLGNSAEDASLDAIDFLEKMSILAEAEGLQLTGWSIYAKAELTTGEKSKLTAWLGKQENFTLLSTHTSITPHQLQVIEELWERKNEQTTEQVKILYYPQEPQDQANVIYKWSGADLYSQWREDFEQIETGFFSKIKHKPQIFSCLEGITNDTLYLDLSYNSPLMRHWITEQLQGQLVDYLDDQQFQSVQAYIPVWDDHVLMYGDTKTNLQLSARYNALDRQSRVTIGYPLILTEH